MSRCKMVFAAALLLVAPRAVPYVSGMAPAASEPALVVQAKSITGLLADLKYVARLIDRGDQFDQLEGVIAAVGGPQGLAGSGLDVDRQFLAYVIAAPGGLDSTFAVMVPVADEQTLVTFLANFAINAKKDSNGVYTLDIPGQLSTIYFKFANKYAYITAVDKGNLADVKLIAPEKLASADRDLVLGVTVRLDQVPDQLKQLALGQIELKLADIKDQEYPDETREQKRMRARGLDLLNYVIKTIVSEGKSIRLQTSIDHAKDDVSLSLALDGKDNTLLANSIALLGEGKSRLSVAESPALHLGTSLTVPVAYRPFLELAARDQVERQSDPAKKEMMSRLCAALAPTLQRGELDAHMVWFSQGESGHFSAVVGIAVEGGEKVEAVAKEAVGKMPNAEQKRIKLNAATTGELSLHQVLLDGAKLDQRTERLFGVNPPNCWAGFQSQAILLGLGKEAAPTFTGMRSVTPSKPSPAITVEAALARLAPLDQRHPGAAKLAHSVFAKAPLGSDTVRMAVDGGKSLKFSASFKGHVLRFLHLLQEQHSEL